MIVSANKTDYPRLMDVWESAVKATHNFLKQEDFDYYKEQGPKYLAAYRLYVYKNDNGKIVGFIGIDETKVELLFVDNASRGKGIGRQLLEFAIGELNADRLDVNEQNGQAIGFYNRLGFCVVGRSEVDGEGKPYPILHLKRTL